MSQRNSGRFFLVSGTGKTGTSWLAEALNHPEAGMVCFDEAKVPQGSRLVSHLRKLRWLHFAWLESRKRLGWLESLGKTYVEPNRWLESAEYDLEHGVGDRYLNYFQFIEGQLKKYSVVGDSHSWEPRLIPEVHQRLPVERIIHLVRNGIQNVQALASHNADLFESNPIFERQLNYYLDIFGGACSGPWEYWCFWWAANTKIPDWLRGQLPDVPVEVFTLEDLVRDSAPLRGIIDALKPGNWVSSRSLEKIIRKNDDRDLTGDRGPDAIWGEWTLAQRETFREFCGESMEFFGYSMP